MPDRAELLKRVEAADRARIRAEQAADAAIREAADALGVENRGTIAAIANVVKRSDEYVRKVAKRLGDHADHPESEGSKS